jgi:DME family drug/metabolite transporter
MPVLVRIAYDDGASPFGLLSLRFIAAFLVLLILQALRGGLSGLRLPAKAAGKLVLLSSVFFAGTSITFYLSVSMLAPSVAELIYFSYPAFVLVISGLVLKERIASGKIAGLAVMLAGVALTVAGPSLASGPAAYAAAGGSHGLTGGFLAVLCAVVYSLYVTFIQDKDIRQAGPAAISTYITGCCAVIFTAAVLLSGGGFPRLGARGISALAAIVVFSTVLPIFLFASGSRELPASEVALIACLEPAVTVIADVLALGRRFDAPTACGLLLIGGGLVLVNALKGRKEAK